MFLHFLALALAYGVSGKDDISILEFKQNRDYVFTKKLYGDVEYITMDGVRIYKAANGSHCVAPNDCWEIIYPNEYLIANGFLKGTHATFTLHPAYPTGRCPVTVKYTRADTPNHPSPISGTRYVFAKEILTNEKLVHVLLFSGKVSSISYDGSITATGRAPNYISLAGWTGVYMNELVLFTGHLETRPRQVVIWFTNGRVIRITIKPSNKTEAMAPALTFIDFMHAFKCM